MIFICDDSDLHADGKSLEFSWLAVDGYFNGGVYVVAFFFPLLILHG